MRDLTQATATELSSLYKAGVASPVTVTEQVLAKIERLNPVLNAFCFTDPATTLAQAQASAQRWQQGQPLSAMDGVPVAVKDSLLTKDWPTLHASFAVNPDQSWSVDAPVVAKFRAAGAVFVGKTTMSEFGITDTNSDSLIYGQVKNPWNDNASSGGSSGGSAVAVASNMAALALASDCGGSITVPSAWCGTVGYKPSHGLIEHAPVDVLNLSTPGLMARTVQDIATAMRCLTNESFQNQCIFHTKNIGLIDANQIPDLDAVVKWLQDQDCLVTPLSLPINQAINIFGQLMEPRILHQWHSIPSNMQSAIGKQFQKKVISANGREQTYAAMIARQSMIEHMQGLMQNFDYILCPSVQYKATSQTYHKIISPWSVFCSVTKQPSITVPCGIDNNSMPVGIMIIGKNHADAQLLAMAQSLASHFVDDASPVILK